MRGATRAAWTVAGLALGAMLSAGVATAQTDQSAAPAAAPAADAATAKPKPKPKKAMPAKAKMATAAVVIVNKRAAGLVELQATDPATGKATKLAGPIAAGKKATGKLQHAKSCVFDLHGSFDDGSETDVPGVDLCADKTLNLVD